MTIVEFLLARLTEDEAWARDAGGKAWKSAPNGYDAGAVETVGGEIVVYDEGNPSEAQAVHIARHNPARVLAECEAKRVMVQLLSVDVRDPKSGIRRTWATEVLGYLALPYADHPDYRHEWKP